MRSSVQKLVQILKQYLFRIELVIALLAVFGWPVAISAQTMDPPKIYTMSPTNINLLNSTYVESFIDLQIGSLSLERSYSSGHNLNTNVPQSGYNPYGYGWTNNYNIVLMSRFVAGESSVRILIGREVYNFTGIISSNHPYDIGVSLTVSGSEAVFRKKDGTAYYFPSNGGVVNRIIRPNGEIVNFAYVSGLPRLISNNMGFAIVFEHLNGKISSTCTLKMSDSYASTQSTCLGNPSKVSYAYNSSGYLAKFTDQLGNYTNYSYLGNQGDKTYMTCISLVNSTVCKILNTFNTGSVGEGVVSRQDLADGSVWKFSCSCGASAQADPLDLYPQEYTTVTPPVGGTQSWIFVQGAPSESWTTVNDHYKYEFINNTPVKFIFPEGNSVVFNHNFDNGREEISSYTFNGKPGGNLVINSQIKTFPQTCINAIMCNLPLTVTDSNGNTTSYSYDFTHGGVLSEMGPAPVVNAARPLKLTTWVQRYAWIKNASGVLVQAATPVWLKSTETKCQTVAGSSTAACDTGALQTVTTYEYGATGAGEAVLVKGVAVASGGTTLRTCYQYDNYARKIAETKPNANLGVCP